MDMEYEDFKMQLKDMVIKHCPEEQIRRFSDDYFRDFYGEGLIHGIGFRNNLRVQLEELDLYDYPEALDYSREIREKLFREVQMVRMKYGIKASKLDF